LRSPLLGIWLISQTVPLLATPQDGEKWWLVWTCHSDLKHIPKLGSEKFFNIMINETCINPSIMQQNFWSFMPLFNVSYFSAAEKSLLRAYASSHVCLQNLRKLLVTRCAPEPA
jgi:hypothetical protein